MCAGAFIDHSGDKNKASHLNFSTYARDFPDKVNVGPLLPGTRFVSLLLSR